MAWSAQSPQSLRFERHWMALSGSNVCLSPTGTTRLQMPTGLETGNHLHIKSRSPSLTSTSSHLAKTYLFRVQATHCIRHHLLLQVSQQRPENPQASSVAGGGPTSQSCHGTNKWSRIARKPSMQRCKSADPNEEMRSAAAATQASARGLFVIFSSWSLKKMSISSHLCLRHLEK